MNIGNSPYVEYDYCGKHIWADNAFVTRKYTDHEPLTLHFCNETEANEYYLDQLRKGEDNAL